MLILGTNFYKSLFIDNVNKIFDISHQSFILYKDNDLEYAKEELKAKIRNAIPEAKRTDD